MPGKKRGTRRRTGSDLARVDAHVVQPEEYDEAPEWTDEMWRRAVVKRGGRPISPNPRKQITIRLPADVIEKWRATGPGWMTRMAARLRRLR